MDLSTGSHECDWDGAADGLGLRRAFRLVLDNLALEDWPIGVQIGRVHEDCTGEFERIFITLVADFSWEI